MTFRNTEHGGIWEGTLEEWKEDAEEHWASFEEKLGNNGLVIEPFEGMEQEFEGHLPAFPIRAITEEDVKAHWNRLAPCWPSPIGVRPIWELLD